MGMNRTDDALEAALAMRELVTPVKRPVVLFPLGRGGNGKSFASLEVVSRARAAGRKVLIGDGDTKTRTLSLVFGEEASAPVSDSMHDGRDWMIALFNQALETGSSVVIDLGAGDQRLKEICNDIDLAGYCEDCGMDVVAMYVLGPKEGDLEYFIQSYEDGYFRPKRQIFIGNLGVVGAGESMTSAFDKTMTNARLIEILHEAGTEMITMKKLAPPVMKWIEACGWDFYKAAQPGTPHMMERGMVAAALRFLEDQRQRLGVADWLP